MDTAESKGNWYWLAATGAPMLMVNPAKECDDEAEAGDLPEVRAGVLFGA